MPRWTDDIFLGVAYAGGTPLSVGDSSPMAVGVGPLGRIYVFDVVPLTLQAAGLATSQNPGSGASFTLTAGTGVTSRVRADGTTEYVLDTPRIVTVTATGANTATYTITGYDQFGQKMTQLIAAPSTSTVATLKAFKTVISVTNANTTASTNGVTVGFGDALGLPISVTDQGYVITAKWNNTLADDAGTLTVADATSPATNATGDVRGTYLLSSASNGTKRLVLTIAVPGIACGPTSTRVGAFGVTQV